MVWHCTIPGKAGVSNGLEGNPVVSVIIIIINFCYLFTVLFECLVNSSYEMFGWWSFYVISELIHFIVDACFFYVLKVSIEELLVYDLQFCVLHE